MKSKTTFALLISLSLHFIVVILTVGVLVQRCNEEFFDNLMVEIFSVQKSRQPLPKKKVAPIRKAQRPQTARDYWEVLPQLQPVNLGKRLLHQTQFGSH